MRRLRRRLGNALAHVYIWACLVVVLLPFLALLGYSFTGPGGTYAVENFQYVLGSFGGNLVTSFQVTGLALLTPAWLVLVHTTDWLPDGSRLWLPTYLSWFVGGMMLAVLQAMRMRAYALACIPLALVCYLIVSTPIAGAPRTPQAA